MEQLPAPHFPVAGKRQEEHGGTKFSVSQGRVAHTSRLNTAPAAGNEVAVISHGPGGC